MLMQQPDDRTLRDRLLDEWQRDFPLVPRPFAVIGKNLGVCEATVIAALKTLQAEGAISRVGGVVRPNTLGASTLAALAAPDDQTEPIAALLSAEPGVNHVYLRENAWNLWFVVTGPDRAYVDEVLRRVSQLTGLSVLDLRLERPYHIDLGFDLRTRNANKLHQRPFVSSLHAAYVPRCIDRALVQILTQGLPLVSEPFARIGDVLELTEGEVLERLLVLVAVGIVPRIGIIVRHRALGWRSNAMVVWDLPEDTIDHAGETLATAPGITLCYRRTRYDRAWPYNLYCMVHARSREEALHMIDQAAAHAGLTACPRQVLFSLRCYKQTGALLALPKEAA